MSYHTYTVWHVFEPWCIIRNGLIVFEFTLTSINSNMEPLDHNMNNEVENFNSSSVNLNGFMHTSGNIFSDDHRHLHHHRHQHQHQVSHPLPFMSMQDGTYTVIGDHQSSSVYDRIIHFPTLEETFGLQHDGAPSRVESFVNLDPPMFSPGFVGDTKVTIYIHIILI